MTTTIEDLQAELDRQRHEFEAALARQRDEVATLLHEVAMLRASVGFVQPESAPPESAPPESAPPESAPPESAPPESAQLGQPGTALGEMHETMTSRRQLLRMATTTAAGAAAAVLAANVLSPERAAANADVTIALGSLATAGIYASPNGTSRPATSLGNEFGVLGTINPGALTPSALANAAVGGFSSGGVGVSGYSSTNTGVYGNTNSGVAVLAISNSGFAVQGLSGSNSAFRGQRGGSGPLPENANYNVATVYGETNTGAAVVGTTAASGYAAIYGYSNQLTGFGVVGAGQGIGVYAQPQGLESSALVGLSRHGTAIYGQTLEGGTAGFFSGPVTVVGPFTVIGGPKSAAVTAPDGTLRRFYTTEAPDPWFEDFGRANLTNGTATVTIEPLFASFVDTDNDYYVFVQPEVGTTVLVVTARSSSTFEVVDPTNKSNGRFSYRIVARRKDLAGHGRLEPVTDSAGQKATTRSTLAPLEAPADVADAIRLFAQAPTLVPNSTPSPAAKAQFVGAPIRADSKG